MAKVVLIKPVISEKAEMLSENANQYTFIVDKSANKIEIRNAIKHKYGVKVSSINTLVMPHKTKSRNTRSRVIQGRVASYKKAVVTVAEGDVIDFYGEI